MKGQVPDGAFATLRQAFRDETIRFLLKPGTITEGFIFLPQAEGGRYVDIRLVSDAYEVGRLQSAVKPAKRGRVTKLNRELRFGFALPLPDGEFD